MHLVSIIFSNSNLIHPFYHMSKRPSKEIITFTRRPKATNDEVEDNDGNSLDDEVVLC
jgi:hypothetical protein